MEPEVGIFWLVAGKLVIDRTPLSRAERDSDFVNHPRSHHSQWSQLQRDGTMPPDMEYEEPPRGRVVYGIRAKQFTLLADRCILERKSLVRRILQELHLPATTPLRTDPHYRCVDCLRGKSAL